MAALHRAVPLPQAGHRPGLVRQDLDLDVPGRVDEFFHIHRAVPERGFPLGHGHGVGLGQFLGRLHQTDAPAPAPGAGFQHHGVADLGGGVQGGRHVRQGLRAGNDLQAVGLHNVFQPGFVAQGLHALRGGADEDQAIPAAEAGKVGVFRQKAVAGVNGLGPGD